MINSFMLPVPKLKQLSETTWKLLEDYTILTSIGLITVKKDYLTDLASIPNWATKVLGVKRDSPKVIVPALIHDVLFQTHACSYLKANDIFLELCKLNKLVIPRRFIMYKTLDLVGWYVYYTYDQEEQEYYKQFLKIVK